MPAKQRGSAVKRGTTWQVRYRDENGAQRGQGGFPTRTAALDWLDTRMNEVLAFRRGDLIPTAHRPQTVDALLDAFLDNTARQSIRRPDGSSTHNSESARRRSGTPP